MISNIYRDPNTYQTKWNGNLLVSYLTCWFFAEVQNLVASELPRFLLKMAFLGCTQDMLKSDPRDGAQGAVLSKALQMDSNLNISDFDKAEYIVHLDLNHSIRIWIKEMQNTD